MSDLGSGMESGLLDVLRWFGLVAVFLASVLTLALYGFRCVTGISWERIRSKFGLGARTSAGSPPSDPFEGAAPLLCWLLSLESWNRQWQKAWLGALNKAALRNLVSFCLPSRCFSKIPCSLATAEDNNAVMVVVGGVGGDNGDNCVMKL